MVTLSEAMKAIRDNKCCKCGKEARALIYRKQTQEAIYFCRRHLLGYAQYKKLAVLEDAG